VKMVAEAAYVFRNEDGSINPNKSYILYHDQGHASQENVDTKHTTCKVFGKQTFASLFKGKYIPITVPPLANGKADVAEVTITNTDLTKNGVATGTISANARIQRIIIRITDSKGNEAVNYVNYLHATSGIANSTSLNSLNKESFLEKLEPGKKYTYEVFANVVGQDVPVQKFEFTA